MALAWLFRVHVTVTGRDDPVSLRVGKALGAATECIAVVVALGGAALFAVEQRKIVGGKVTARPWVNWVVLGLMIAVSGGEIHGLLAEVDGRRSCLLSSLSFSSRRMRGESWRLGVCRLTECPRSSVDAHARTLFQSRVRNVLADIGYSRAHPALASNKRRQPKRAERLSAIRKGQKNSPLPKIFEGDKP